MIRFIAAAAAVSLAASAGSAELPDTPAASRLAEIVSFTSGATPGGIGGFIDRTYTADYADLPPLEARIAGFMDWKARGGFRIIEVVESADDHIEAVVEHPVTDERWRMRVEVAGADPHRVSAVYLGRDPLPALEHPLSDREIADALIDYTGSLAEAGLFSGAIGIARNGEVLAQRAWGEANRDFGAANNTQTRFNLGSMNKTWTAVAVAQLVERGALSFGDPLSKFVDYPDADTAARIRIEHLLTHTSGLQSYFTEEFDRTARKDLRTIDDFLALSADQPLAFEPGTDWAYSNTGMLVLGKVIEAASGQGYFDYVDEYIFEPAGMTRSGCFELDRVNDNLAVGYARRWTTEGPVTINNLFEHVVRGGPAGGCYSTVGDLFRFAQALHDGTLVDPDMAETLTTPKPALGSPDYGFGFQVEADGAAHGHGGGFVGISANLDIVEEPAGWVVVVLANDEGARAPMFKARQLIGVAAED